MNLTGTIHDCLIMTLISMTLKAMRNASYTHFPTHPLLLVSVKIHMGYTKTYDSVSIWCNPYEF
jgi:hypothetical protein